MARFIAGIQAWKSEKKSEVTRLASMEASTWLRTWKGGVTVNAFFDKKNKQISFQIYKDEGSNNPGKRVLIYEFQIKEKE